MDGNSVFLFYLDQIKLSWHFMCIWIAKALCFSRILLPIIILKVRLPHLNVSNYIARSGQFILSCSIVSKCRALLVSIFLQEKKINASSIACS